MNVAQLVIQGGSLGVLAALLWMLFQLVRGAMPFVQAHVTTLESIRESLASLKAEFERHGDRISHLAVEVRELKERGVCPMLVAREGGQRPTEPEAG